MHVLPGYFGFVLSYHVQPLVTHPLHVFLLSYHVQPLGTHPLHVFLLSYHVQPLDTHSLHVVTFNSPPRATSGYPPNARDHLNHSTTCIHRVPTHCTWLSTSAYHVQPLVTHPLHVITFTNPPRATKGYPLIARGHPVHSITCNHWLPTHCT